jgi:glutathione S-transferase
LSTGQGGENVTAPILWQYNFSNFNEKARWALDFKGIPHVRRSLLPAGPRAMLFSLRGTLPVLDLDGKRIVDSTRIIEALERRYPEPALYPQDEAGRRKALELEDFFDEQAGHELRRAIFYELRDNPDYVSALLTTERGPTARRLFRAFLSLPGAMAYPRRRYKIYPADAEEGRAKVAGSAPISVPGPTGMAATGTARPAPRRRLDKRDLQTPPGPFMETQASS